MVEGLVEFAPSVLARPQSSVGLRRWVQPVSLVGDNNKLLKVYSKVVLVGAPSLVRGLVWCFVNSYCACLAGCFFSVLALCTLMGWGWPVPRAFASPTLPRFSVTSYFVPMWATVRRQISLNVFGRYLIRESLKGPDNIPRLKACTIMDLSLGCSFTTSAPNRFRKSFKGSPWYCFTSKRSKEMGGGA